MSLTPQIKRYVERQLQGLGDGTAPSAWIASGSDIAYTQGNVGIGVAPPSYLLDVGGDLNIAGVYRIGGTQVLSATTLGSGVITSSLTTVGTIGTGVWQGTAIANAYIATGLDVTKLTVGTTLPSNVVTSSLTAVGTIATGVWQGTAISDTYLATISTAGKVSNSATTATSANTVNAIVARDASGNFSAGTITAALSGNASTATKLATARNINGVAFDGTADITITAAAGTLTGNTLASGVTASSLTSVGTLTSLAVSGAITEGGSNVVRQTDIGSAPNEIPLNQYLGSMAYQDASAINVGTVAASTVTATTVTAALTGNASTATKLATPRNINGVAFDGSADITVGAGIPGGSANGVAYLNSSSVLSAGTALVFDGSTLGVGVTPTTWSFKAIQVADRSALWGTSDTTILSVNNYYASGSNKYIGNGRATRYTQSGATHTFEFAPDNTSGAGANITSFTSQLIMDSAGIYSKLDHRMDGNLVVGSAAIATNATTGFLYVPSCAGTPTGTPTTKSGTVPIVVDTTNHKLYFYSGGSWRDAGP